MLPCQTKRCLVAGALASAYRSNLDPMPVVGHGLDSSVQRCPGVEGVLVMQ